MELKNKRPAMASQVVFEVVNCPLCNSSEHGSVLVGSDWLYGNPGEFSVVACSRCSFPFVNPRPTESCISSFYPEQYWDHEDSPFDKDSGYTPLLRSLLESPSLGSRKVLDVGCGSGRFLELAQSRGWQVRGIEPSQFGTQRSNQRLGAELVTQGVLTDLPTSEKFDLITILDVLEHVHDPVRVLSDCKARLAPGGKLLVRSPNFSTWERALFGVHWYGLQLPIHLTHFSRHHMQSAGVKAGLRMVAFGGARISWFYLSFDQWLHRRSWRPGQVSLKGPTALIENSAAAQGQLRGRSSLNWKGRLLYQLVGALGRLDGVFAKAHEKIPGLGPIFTAVFEASE